jgi:hypothetical protein
VKKYILAMALVAALGILIQSGCGGKGTGITHIVATPGSLAVFGGDAPLCSVISFTVTIAGLTLTPQSGSSPVSVLPAGNAVTVDFASLMDFATMFSLSNVPPGTYDALGITLSNPQLTYLDTSTTPASFKTIAPTMSSLSISLNLSPAVTITSNSTVALQLEFDLLNSVLTGSNNQITGSVNPTFTANLASASGSNGFAQFDDLSGVVQSVSTSSTNPSFVGSFTISRPNAPTLTINASSSTTFAGVSGLSALTAGTFVQARAFLDTNANIVANTVVAEAQEDQASGEAAFTGLVTSVTPQSGNATQFTLLVQEENPEVSSRVALFSPLTFDIVPSSTTFGLSAQAADFANFSFGPSNLAAGQRVVVHGTLPSGSGAAQSATARSVFLGLQSILGNLSTNPSTPVTTVDGVDGGFALVPCSPLFQPAQITVLSAQQTAFVGITNLYSLNNPGSHFLLVKGLLFYEQSTTTFGVASWTVPANVQVATEVHQLPSP